MSFPVITSIELKNSMKPKYLSQEFYCWHFISVFEKFREISHMIYCLDPAHYYTLYGYTFDCILRYKKSSLKTIQDVDFLKFLERGIRNGISQCSNRYSKTNNKYLSNHDPSNLLKTLLNIDLNNLYGWSICQPLSYGRFESVDT